MEYIITENVKVWQKYDPMEIAGIDLNPKIPDIIQEPIFNEINLELKSTDPFAPETSFDFNRQNIYGHAPVIKEEDPDLMYARIFGENPTRILIKDTWYDVITPQKACRMKNNDGYYRFVYIQINYETNEFYVGKVNRNNFRDFKNYSGSGLLFKLKFKKHSQNFVQYYIAHCKTQEESCEIEARIVDKKLLSDPKCLNLVKGGGGVAEHPLEEDRRNKIRAYNKAHPEQWQKMLARAHEIYSSKNPEALKERGKKISQGIRKRPNYSSEISSRIKNWIKNNPEEYKAYRERNIKAVRNSEVQRKRWETRLKWAKEHPEEWQEWVKKGIAARQTPEANRKRKESLRRFRLEHPDIARINDLKRAQAAAKKFSIPVIMYDLKTNKTIKEFINIKDAGKWLIEQGRASGKNPSSAICAVCLYNKDPNGKHRVRKSAFGFGWKYK